MTEQDILCEVPGPDGMHCTLPYGHQPADIHSFEVEIPAQIGMLLEQFMSQAERQKQRWLKAERRANFWRWVWMGMTAVYLGLVIYQLTRLG